MWLEKKPERMRSAYRNLISVISECCQRAFSRLSASEGLSERGSAGEAVVALVISLIALSPPRLYMA